MSRQLEEDVVERGAAQPDIGQFHLERGEKAKHLTEGHRPVRGGDRQTGRLGCRNAEIADRLSLSVETVKTYMRNVMDKLDVHSRHEAVVEARRQGLLP